MTFRSGILVDHPGCFLVLPEPEFRLPQYFVLNISGQLFLACVYEAGSDSYLTEMKLTHLVLLFQEAFLRAASETCAVLAEVLLWKNIVIP